MWTTGPDIQSQWARLEQFKVRPRACMLRTKETSLQLSHISYSSSHLGLARLPYATTTTCVSTQPARSSSAVAWDATMTGMIHQWLVHPRSKVVLSRTPRSATSIHPPSALEGSGGLGLRPTAQQPQQISAEVPSRLIIERYSPAARYHTWARALGRGRVAFWRGFLHGTYVACTCKKGSRATPRRRQRGYTTTQWPRRQIMVK